MIVMVITLEWYKIVTAQTSDLTIINTCELYNELVVKEKIRRNVKTCWALIEEEAKDTDFLVCKSIVGPGIDFLIENLLGLWVKDGSVAFRETQPSISIFILIEVQIVRGLHSPILMREKADWEPVIWEGKIYICECGKIDVQNSFWLCFNIIFHTRQEFHSWFSLLDCGRWSIFCSYIYD